MSKQLQFTKMHGLGNDFMVIDGINQQIELPPERIVAWADRHFGIGFDQLLLVQKATTDRAQFRYRIFNADGGEVAQCGNGARCFARFVREQGLTDKTTIDVETDSGLLTLRAIDDIRIEVEMGVPAFEPEQIPLVTDKRQLQYEVLIDNQRITFSALSMGNPHAIIQVDDIDTAPVAILGPALQAHASFPNSVNVGFMQITDRGAFKLRVYERGVGETLACGSGACAAMVAGVQLDRLDQQACARLTGGELQLHWQGADQPVMMTGDTAVVYRGVITV